MSDHLGLDSGVVDHLLPLGDSIVGAVVTLLTAAITYAVGRSKTKAEVEKIEADTGVSTAEAAQVISEAAAATVQPLLERIREQREDIRFLTDRNVALRDELDNLRITTARLRSDNEILNAKLKIYESNPEVK